ncbi:hypothetical protein FO519_006310 [Halicephalobus sp. NKZ332]|nr:hypothetical protein FO519_006310 [Halicephalobus sp. NKZ332]
MEQEWTEDEESRNQSGDLGNLSEEENSGTEANTSQRLLLDPNLEPEQPSDEQAEETEVPRRRSTRKLKKVLQSPENEVDMNTEVNKDEDQTEWKLMDKRKDLKKKRKRKAPITVDRRKRERDRERRNRMKVVEKESSTMPLIPKKTRSRGRPRKEPIHFEGEFDVYDEDKTPENAQSPMDTNIDEDGVPKEVFEVVEEIHIDKMNESGEAEEKKYFENFDDRSLENPPSDGSAQGCSVAITLSADAGDYDQNDGASDFDPEELLQSELEMNSKIQESFEYQYPYSIEDDDENTQYSVEAELARYAREDALMELRSNQEVSMDGNFDFHEEEDPEIQQELEQLTNMNEVETEYYVVEENGEAIYYAVHKINDDEKNEIERPIPPMEFDPDNPRQEETNLETEYYENYDENKEEFYFKNGVNNFEEFQSEPGESDSINPNLEGINYDKSDEYNEDDEFRYMGEEMEVNSTDSEASTMELTLGQLSIGGEVVEVPDIVLENEGVFRHILSPGTFFSLSEEHQTHLKRFLPRNLDDEETEKCIFSALTHDQNHYFGSPLSRAFNKIRAGFYNVDRPTDLHQLQDNRRVWYDHFIRRHYMKLLRTLVVARHAILEQAASLPDDVPIKIDSTKFVNTKKRDAKETVRFRARMRARTMINFAAEKGPEDSDSSDESDLDLPLAPVSVVTEAESSVFSPEFLDIDLDMYQPEKIRSVKEMLKNHKILKRKNPDCPSLDLEGLALEDIYERTGLSFQSERNFLQLSSKEEIVSKKRRKRKKKNDPADEQTQVGFCDLFLNAE